MPLPTEDKFNFTSTKLKINASKKMYKSFSYLINYTTKKKKLK